jgi:hypothetical protein
MTVFQTELLFGFGFSREEDTVDAIIHSDSKKETDTAAYEILVLT